MARISEARTQRHKSVSASADVEFPTTSVNKRIQWHRGGGARMASAASEPTENPSKSETISKNGSEHGKEARQNKLVVREEDVQLSPQAIKQAEKHGGKAITKSTQFSAVPTNSPDIEKDQAALQQLDKLKATVEGLGGKLEGGWQVTSQRRSKDGSPFFSFISPTKERFRSRVEVVRHLGLSASPAKRKSPSATCHTLLNDQLAIVPYRRRKKTSAKSSKVKSSKVGKDHVPTSKILCSPESLKHADDSQVTSIYEFSASAITQRCRDVLRSIISTQNFAIVSNMFSWGTPSPSMDSALQPSGPSRLASSLDLKLINLRLSTGAYGQSPELFSADIQQVWKNIIATGNELVSLAGSLSDLSECLYKQQMLSLFEGMPQGMVQTPSRKGRRRSIDETLFGSFPERTIAKRPDDGSFKEVTTGILVKDYVGMNCRSSACQATQGRPQRSLLSEKKNTARYELRKKFSKRGGNSKEPITSEGRLSLCSTDSAYQKYAPYQHEEQSACIYCKAPYYANCVVPSSVPGGGCCTLCFLTQAAENAYEMETFGNEIMDKETQPEALFMNSKTTDRCQSLQNTDDKAGICEICNIEDDNVLLCDACDAAYHMNCLTPPMHSVPDGYWYCPPCDEAGKNIVVFKQDMDVHNCSVCKRVSKELVNCTENESTAQVFSKDTPFAYLAPELSMDCGCRASSLDKGASENGLDNKLAAKSLSSETENVCKLCEVDGGKILITCSNCKTCYHLSCLRPALRKRPRKTWYCPSCLCRVCKIDVDDDKILLCDSCDEGFHIYCLKPPLMEIPQKAWFCRSCIEARPIHPEVAEK